MRRLRDRPLPNARGLAVGTAATLGVGLLAALLATGLTATSANSGAVHPAAMAVLLTFVVLPAIWWAVDRERKMFWILLAGFGAKVVGTVGRVAYNAAFGADAYFYDRSGASVARMLSTGLISPDDSRIQGGSFGTRHVSYVVGWIYHLGGRSMLTAYVVFSFLSFIGLLFFYKAATIAVPQLDRVRYALLIFFYPSMLFWPSSIGKEAFMLCFLGIAAYGAAGLLDDRYSLNYGIALALGTAATAWIRPHVAAMIVCAAVPALFWPTRGTRSRIVQLAAIAVGAVAISFMLGQVADFFGSERFEVTEFLNTASGRTAQGGSQFTPVRISGPLSFAFGLVTVFFRPFIFEGSSFFQIALSVESMMLMALIGVSARRLRQLPAAFSTSGYVRMTVYYALGFVMAFSVIANFGILARQRSQLWPFILVLLALIPAIAAEKNAGQQSEKPSRAKDTAVDHVPVA